ncbi:unnamed protein product, partial [Meganyctiphanes norvegica]
MNKFILLIWTCLLACQIIESSPVAEPKPEPDPDININVDINVNDVCCENEDDSGPGDSTDDGSVTEYYEDSSFTIPDGGYSGGYSPSYYTYDYHYTTYDWYDYWSDYQPSGDFLLGGNCPYCPPNSGCGGDNNNSSGSINYPGNYEDYPNKACCIWNIETSATIDITFTRFDLEAGFDFLYIFW